MAYQFPPDTEKRFQWLITRYPKKDAALLPILHLVQNEIGFLTTEAIDYVASRVDVSPARVKEVASFYSMFRFQPSGKFVLQVCHNISCYLRGSDDLISHVKATLGIQEGETTKDGLFSLERVECLASCGTAPVMQVNCWDFHENLDVERLDQVIQALKQSRWAQPCYADRSKEGSPA